MSKWKDKTLGGYPVRIYAEDGVDGWPIHGAVMCDNGWRCRCWRHDGTSLFSSERLILNNPTIDWSKQPDWCKAVAMDKDGKWYRFDGTPKMGESLFYPNNEVLAIRFHPSEYPAFDGDWKDSLCIRPEGGVR